MLNRTNLIYGLNSTVTVLFTVVLSDHDFF